jgi:hypothetical protein
VALRGGGGGVWDSIRSLPALGLARKWSWVASGGAIGLLRSEVMVWGREVRLRFLGVLGLRGHLLSGLTGVELVVGDTQLGLSPVMSIFIVELQAVDCMGVGNPLSLVFWGEGVVLVGYRWGWVLWACAMFTIRVAKVLTGSWGTDLGWEFL